MGSTNVIAGRVVEENKGVVARVFGLSLAVVHDRVLRVPETKGWWGWRVGLGQRSWAGGWLRFLCLCDGRTHSFIELKKNMRMAWGTQTSSAAASGSHLANAHTSMGESESRGGVQGKLGAREERRWASAWGSQSEGGAETEEGDFGGDHGGRDRGGAPAELVQRAPHVPGTSRRGGGGGAEHA